jgi:hypothetical protein
MTGVPSVWRAEGIYGMPPGSPTRGEPVLSGWHDGYRGPPGGPIYFPVDGVGLCQWLNCLRPDDGLAARALRFPLPMLASCASKNKGPVPKKPPREKAAAALIEVFRTSNRMSERPEVAAVAGLGVRLSPLRRQGSSRLAKGERAYSWAQSSCVRRLDSCLRRNDRVVAGGVSIAGTMNGYGVVFILLEVLMELTRPRGRPRQSMPLVGVKEQEKT